MRGASIPAAGLPEAADPSGGPARGRTRPGGNGDAAWHGGPAVADHRTNYLTNSRTNRRPHRRTSHRANRRSKPHRVGCAAPLPAQVAELERRAMAAARQVTGGNRMAVARLLKISRAAFYDQLARYPELVANPLLDASAD